MKAKAAVLEKFEEDFLIKEIDISASNREIIINVKACGICGRDLVIWKGGFRNLKTPLILGHEVYGEFEGKPVGVFSAITCGNCKYCLSGKENLCNSLILLGEGKNGGYASAIAVPKENVFPLPDRNYEFYAASVCAIATSIHASKLAGGIKGKNVLVTGAGGGVGIHMIQYLNYAGAKVIALTSKQKEEKVKEFADELITEKEFSKQVKDVDVVMELVGSETINESLRSLSKEGILILIGNITGNEISLKRPALTIMREQKIIGSAAYTKKEVEEAIRLIHEGFIKPVYKTYPLEEINTAYLELRNANVLGRAVLKIS